MISLWSKDFDINSTGETYFVDDREQIGEDKLLNTRNVHFRNQKCLNGIALSYINDTKDIYKKSLLTGDSYSINNMYNEFNLIDKYLENLHRIDIAINLENNDVDLSIPHFELDFIKLKPGHKILLYNHPTNSTINDIYIVTKNYYLELSDLLSTREKSDKAKFYIKLGTYKETQFFLENESTLFPISDEVKHFTQHHSYLLKNELNYDINSSANTAKILFSNYDVARFQQDNIPLYESMSIIDVGSEIVIELTITNPNTTISLDLKTGFEYDTIVNWGDGSAEYLNVIPVSDTTKNHTFLIPGIYFILFDGKMQTLEFNLGSRNYITNIISFGSSSISELKYIDFSECNHLKNIPTETDGLIAVEDFGGFFKNCEDLEAIPETIFNSIPNNTSFEEAFYNCKALTSIPEMLFKENIHIENFDYVFYNCISLTEIPQMLFKTNVLVTTFSNAFAQCTSITDIQYHIFKTNLLVEDFSFTFNNCSSLISISEELFFNNTLVVSFKSCFNNCINLTEIPTKLFKYNIGVTDFESTFNNCISLIIIPYILFDTNQNVENFNSCFYNCTSLVLKTPKLWDITMWPNVIHYNNCFKYTGSLACNGTNIPTSWGGSCNTSNCTGSICIIIIPNWNL